MIALTVVWILDAYVVFAWRSFEAYPILVELAGARPVRVPLDDAEGHDLDAMAAAVTERTNGTNCKGDPLGARGRE